MKSREPSQEYLRERFGYDHGVGALVWKYWAEKSASTNSRDVGQVAGWLCPQGYRHVQLGDSVYRCHRLVWVYFNGAIPDGSEIDHINRVRNDNRVANLRLANRSLNCGNKATKKKLPVGVKINTKGVIYAHIRLHGKQTYLGMYKTVEEAGAAYALAYELHYGKEHPL